MTMPIISTCALMVIGWASAAAHPVEVTVTVRDPNGAPVAGAHVMIGSSYFAEPTDKDVLTDGNGVAVLTIDVPAAPARRLVWVTPVPDDLTGEPWTWLEALNEKAKQYQFPIEGTPFDVLPGQNTAQVTVDAEAVVEFRFTVEPAGTHGFTVHSGIPRMFSRNDLHSDDGPHSLWASQVDPVFSISRNNVTRLYSPIVPPEADLVDIGVVDLDPPRGRVAGTIVSNGGPPPRCGVAFMSVDGAFHTFKFVNNDGVITR